MASPRQPTFLFAVWFGIVFGLVGGTELYLFYRFSPSALGAVAVTADIIWVEPAVDLVLFLIAGLAWRVLCRFMPGHGMDSQTRLFAFFSFLSFVGITFFAVVLTRWGAFALACGLTAACVRWIRPRAAKAAQFVRRTLPVVVVVWLLVTAAIVAGGRWNERESALRLSLPKPGSPNILLIVLDTVGAQRLSLYGHHRATTPNLESFAAQGLMFENAIANSSWTLPSHASLFTGLQPHEHGTNKNALAAKYRTLPEALMEAGYLTAAFVANTNVLYSRMGMAQGFLRYDDAMSSFMDSLIRTGLGRRVAAPLARLLGHYDTPGRKSASEVTSDFLRWVDHHSDHHRPFFAFLNYFDAHDPYFPPREFAERFSSSAHRIRDRKPPDFWNYREGDLTAEQQQIEIDAYDAVVAYLDFEMGRLFAELGRRGILDRTLVVITSDHGESMFQHNSVGHSTTLYREVIHVPLILRYPGRVPGGERISRPIDLAEVWPLIDRYSGIASGPLKPAGPHPFAWDDSHDSSTGPSLAFSALDADLWKSPNQIGARWIRSLVTSRWHFVQNPDGSAELYDWASDAAELNNLAGTPEGQAVVGKLRAKLESQTESKTAAARSAPRTAKK